MKKIKKLLKTSIAALCAITICAAYAPSTYAATSVNTVYFDNGEYEFISALNSNKCVDVSNNLNADNTNVHLYTRNGSAAQKFTVVKVSGPYYKIIHTSSGKVLDAWGGSSAGNQSNVSIYGFHGGDNQLWSFESAGNGYYYIVNKKRYYLDVSGGNTADGTNIWIYTRNASSAQKWRLRNTFTPKGMKYIQTDAKWANYRYGGDTLKESGCGVFSFVNAVYTLTGKDMGVLNVAQWAHDIGAYNPKNAKNGVDRTVMYPEVNAKYGSQYGINVTNIGCWEGASSSKLSNHLKNGGVAVAHVPGHFLAIVGYSNGKFLVYDNAPSSRNRQTTSNGDWKTVRQLSTGGLKIDWFCLISRSPTYAQAYFNKCNSGYTNFVNALKSIGADTSYNYRKKIAAVNGISNYTGTTAQNNSLLGKLKAGKLIKP